MLLATDLDGTFLGGRQADRLALYRTLRSARDVRLVFVTGRGVESVLPLLTDPLIPDPEFIIGDVGATVVATARVVRPVAPFQWRDRANVDRQRSRSSQALRDVPGLVRQPVPQERRVSFFLDESRSAWTRSASGWRTSTWTCCCAPRSYLDVLPRGA